MSKYPNQIDSDVELPSALDGATENTAEAVNAAKDAIIAIEKAIGVNPQGSTDSLNDRVSVSLNSDGTIKSSALATAGVVSLPITNAQVGASAAIEESKLDLNFPTQDLKNSITSAEIDIDNLQNAISTNAGNFAQHVSGLGFRHNANHIVTSPAINGTLNVQNTLADLDARINAHIASATAHSAASITYVPPVDSDVVSNNVQGVIDELVLGQIGELEIHERNSHATGITGESNTTLLEQSSTSAASLAMVPILPMGGQKIIKIGRINAASIVSNGLAPTAMTASASNIDIEYNDGYSLKTVSVNNLDSVTYQSGIIDFFNEAFANAKAPLTAFPFKNEFVVQHNWPGFTFRFVTPSFNSAAVPLGVSNILDQDATSASFYSVTDGDHRNEEFLPQTTTLMLPSATNTIILPFTIAVGSLIHIQNHTNDGNGTYQCVGFSGSSCVLNQVLPAGICTVFVYSDSVVIGASSAGQVFDLTVDKNLKVKKALRSAITIGQINDIQMISVDLLPGAYSLSTTVLGGNVSFQLIQGSVAGPTFTVKNGYFGEIELFDSKGLKVVILLNGAISGNFTDQFTVYPKSFNLQNQLIGSYYTNGSVSSYVLDKRSIGTVGEKSISKLGKDSVLGSLKATQYNGLVFPLTYSFTSTVLNLPEMHFYLDGTRTKIPAQSMSVASLPDNTYHLYIDSTGLLQTTILSIKDIVALKGIPLVGFVMQGGIVVSNNNIGLLFAGPLDKIIVSQKGHTRTINGGAALASGLGLPLVVDNFASTETVSISVPTIFSGICSVASLNISGTHVKIESLSTESIVLNNDAYLSANILTVNTTVTVDNSTLLFKTITVKQFIGTGTKVVFSGIGNGTVLGTFVITLNNATKAYVQNFTTVGNSTAFVSITGTNTDICFSNISSTFKPLTASSARTDSFGFIFNTGTIASLKIQNISYQNRGPLIGNIGTITSIMIENIQATTCGPLLINGNFAIESLFANNLLFKNMAGSFITSTGTINGLNIDHFIIDGSFASALEPVGLISAGTVIGRVSNFICKNWNSTTDIISVGANSNQVFDGAHISNVVSNKYFVASLAGGSVYLNNMNASIDSNFLNGHFLTIDSCSITNIKTGSAIFNSIGTTLSTQRLKVKSSVLNFIQNTQLNIPESIIEASEITGGEFVFVSTGSDLNGMKISNNILNAIKATAAVSFTFNGGLLNKTAYIKSNVFSGSPTNTLVKFTRTNVDFVNNSLIYTPAVSGESVIETGTSPLINDEITIDENQIYYTTGTIQNIFRILGSATIVSNNFVRGASNVAFHSNASAAQVNVKCIGNKFLSTPAISTTNLNSSCIVRDNVGCVETLTMSVFGAMQVPSSSFGISTDELITTAAGTLYLRLPLLPCQVLSVSVEAFCTGSVNCSLIYQQAIASSPIVLGTKSNVGTGSAQTITITLSTPYYAKSTDGLTLKIVAGSVGTFFGNAKITYKI